MSKTSPFGSNWEDVKKEIFTPEEIDASRIRVALMGELTKARLEKGMTQQELEEKSGVRQPVIARMESGKTSPQVDTLIKLLRPLGMTIAIVPLQAQK